jgi:[acyl-carrier-protein] S-malonyltransferase
MKTAFLFPGQGSQAVGMGKALAEAFPEAKAVFDEADAALGEPLSRLCFEGPEEALRLTANTQPTILTVSVAVHRVLAARGIVPDVVAGHSLGEYSALVAAGSIPFADAVRAVRLRGGFMQEAVPPGAGAMAAVMGLAPEKVAEACRAAAEETGEVVSPANFNSPEQTVIAGSAKGVARASELVKEAGAKRALPLPVSAPFHCSLMGPAEEKMKPVLGAIDFRDFSVPLVTNVDAVENRSGEAARSALIRQIVAPVRWVESVERIAALGAERWFEVGPGKVLGGLVGRIVKGTNVLSVCDPESVERALAG